MSIQGESFFLNLERLQQLQKEHGFSDSKLSESIGMHRTWLYTIKKKEDGPSVDLSQANLIAEQLNCTIQEIGDTSKNECFNPVVFDYAEESKRLLDELLPQNAEMISHFLRFIKSATSEQKEDLINNIFELEKQKYKDYPWKNDSWWTVLFISEFSKVLVEELELCRDSNLFDEYNQNMQNVLEIKRNSKKLELIRAGKSKETADEEVRQLYLDFTERHALMKHLVQRIASQRYQELLNEEILDRTCDACAEFLVSYSIKSTPGYDRMVSKFKRGILF